MALILRQRLVTVGVSVTLCMTLIILLLTLFWGIIIKDDTDQAFNLLAPSEKVVLD